jgi:hypothetical protein
MLSKEEQIIKEKILKETRQDKIVHICKTEDITMNIMNDKEVQEHIAKYVKVKELEGSGHIYLRKKENATKEYIDYINEIIEKSTY